MAEGWFPNDFVLTETGTYENRKKIFAERLETVRKLWRGGTVARINPMGARLHAIFGSDIGHWDVTDVREVLEEAWELVERGTLTSEDFRDFSFANPARFWTANNPGFFDGTAVESSVRSLLA